MSSGMRNFKIQLSINMKKLYLLIPFFTMGLVCTACNDDDKVTPIVSIPATAPEEAKPVLESIYATSALDADLTARRVAFAKMQKFADDLPYTIFNTYLASDDNMATALEGRYPAICTYNLAFEKALNDIKEAKPANGEAYIWLMYNMGYVIKTSEGAFAVDIFNRRAAELEPYIDFYCMTHIHNDHKSIALADAMVKAGKPVLSNFYDSADMSEEDKDYTIGSFKIHSFITKHNNSATSNVPVTVYKVDCGQAGGNLVVMHSGDSNFTASEFESVKDAKVDVYIPRYAPEALTENRVIGAVFKPTYVLLSHIMELTHKDVAGSRWTLELGLERASKLNCDKTYMPFWGEKLVWKNGQLTK